MILKGDSWRYVFEIHMIYAIYHGEMSISLWGLFRLYYTKVQVSQVLWKSKGKTKEETV